MDLVVLSNNDQMKTPLGSPAEGAGTCQLLLLIRYLSKCEDVGRDGSISICEVDKSNYWLASGIHVGVNINSPPDPTDHPDNRQQSTIDNLQSEHQFAVTMAFLFGKCKLYSARTGVDILPRRNSH